MIEAVERAAQRHGRLGGGMTLSICDPVPEVASDHASRGPVRYGAAPVLVLHRHLA
jgi:hypothetical protein